MVKKFTYLLFCLLLLSSCKLKEVGFFEMKKQPKESTENRQLIKEDQPAGLMNEDIKITAAGDSLTQGVGDSTKNGGYLPYLQKDIEENGMIRPQIYNFGVKGHRTEQLLKRLNKKELKDSIQKSDAVILTIGGNDVMKVFRENITNLKLQDFNREKEAYRMRLFQILAKIKAINSEAEVYIVGLYNPFYKWTSNVKELKMILDEWNKATEESANEFSKCYFVKIEDIFISTKEELLFQDDYFHPNDRGYEHMGNRIYQALNQYTLKRLLLN
ncbi:lysophospholipase L1-like esterase [Peribacillus deserti]|uniref:Lysophospholipase L1-like esterase n=1 Tax=Peribacillus deserti TaxID=673318 RepID=A0ABS2QH94_9BACI|nr:SGNH/GDSL hydrolase family protein [Peribacillus deserti]MBM7692540.1 lysophospholipase L1-like esterase [Peribacillus deserti]